MAVQSSILLRLLARFKKQKSLTFTALIGTILQVSLTVYLPVLIGQAVDAVLIDNNWPLIGSILLRMLVLIFINTLVQWGNPLIYNRLIYQTVGELRQELIVKIHRLPLAYLDRQSAGDLVSRVTTDTEQLSNGLLMVFNQFFIGLLTIMLTIFSMGQLDGILMLMVIGLTPMSLLIARFIAKKSYTFYQKQTHYRGQLTDLLEETLNQEALLQQFNAQEEFSSRFKSINQQYSDYSQGAIFYASAVNPATRFVNALIYALLAGVGGLRIMQVAFTVGQLTAFLNYANQYTKPFNDISSVFAELQSAVACAERLFAILDQQELIDSSKSDLETKPIQGRIDFRDVDFSYLKDQPLIQGMTLSVPAGSRIAVVGPTGAGKSTLINLLMRFYDVDRGQILLDGTPIQEYKRETFRQQIGLVLQDTWIRSATVHDNIAYGCPEASREDVIAAAEAAHADFFIRQLPQGYDTFLSSSEGSLSQGQAQLLAIARVFLKEPRILILDEATSSVDTRTEKLIQEAFSKLMQGRTSFIIAHRLSTIETADLIIVMIAGRIAETGSHTELMAKRGFYYQLHQAASETADS